ncbi:MAG: ATP-dependent RecD-like DNA helicase [Deltaproteobacteria bacterium]|nr:ATP-dependent RecD-like DNA helicase [Deltaproteobacteria bacterium]MCB9787770.1 ATP-dependent RecD-like DNA helicase [Deltaproteobacteria bacterium]
MSDLLEGTVERIRFVNEESHWTVFSVRPDGDGHGGSVTVVGVLPGVVEGMPVRVEGEWNDDPRFGRQLRATRCVERIPATREGLAAYLASGFIAGIGPRMAERLVDRFGLEVLDVIRREPERLREVQGLGSKRAETVAAAVRERHGPQEAMVFLYGLGITPGLAGKIYQRYREDTVPTVRRNPYAVSEEVHGIGFHKADQVARGLSIERDHPARLRAGALHVLREARGEGHCFLPRRELVSRTGQLTEVDDLVVDPAVDALVADRKVVLETLPHDPNDQAVYPVALHTAEQRVAAHIGDLLEARVLPTPDLAERVGAAAVALGIDLADEQAAAVMLALTTGVVVITGGPGTGKTTIIRTLLVASGLAPHDIELAAPTGRAAKRMAEATGHEARTIHRLLEFSPKDGQFVRDEDTPLEAKLVIIDEASMADLPLFDALVRAVPPGARLVLVGDVDQLPPVGPGSPLTDLIRSRRVQVARLTRIFRQGAGSAIVESAHRINRGEVPEVTPPGTPRQDFYFIQRSEPDDIVATIEEVISARIPQGFGLDPMRDVQVLAPMRAGPVGVDALNLRLQALLNPVGEELRVGHTTYRKGDRVMQIRNDYDRGVFNGDMGFVMEVHASQRRLLVAIDEKPVVYEKEQLEELVLAYAISVHKSQGSEYPAVVMPVTTHHFKMLQRNLVYTGITRGRRLVVIVGTPRAMGIAVRNSDVAARNTLLAERLADPQLGATTSGAGVEV